MLTAVKKQTYMFILPPDWAVFGRQDAMSGSAVGGAGNPEDLGQTGAVLCAQDSPLRSWIKLRCAAVHPLRMRRGRLCTMRADADFTRQCS